MTSAVRKAVSAGWSLEETLERVPLGEAYSLPPDNPRAAIMVERHRYNLQKTYKSLAGD